MKNKHLFKFSLSALFSMVLAACGSNGSDAPTATATPTVTPTPVVETTNTTPTTTPAPEEKTENTIENPDAQKLDVQPAESAFVGYKHVSKNNSRFLINEDTDGSKPHSADIPVGMNLRNLSPVMDTLVVAEPTRPDANGKIKVGYLEDLDFRSGDGSPNRREIGTFAFMQMAHYSSPNRPDKGNVQELLGGRRDAERISITLKSDTGYTLTDTLAKDFPVVERNITYADYKAAYELETTRLKDARDLYDVEIVDARNTPPTIDVQGNFDWTDRDLAIQAVEYNLLQARLNFAVETTRLDRLCYSSGNRACSEKLDVNYSEEDQPDERAKRNAPKYYTVHVADSKVGRDGKTRINDRTDNEEKSEFRSWAHMINPALGKNNTKSDRKAVDKNEVQNQYYAYTYQNNRTNYTDETMPHGLMAVPVYEGTGENRKLVGYKNANLATDYTNDALRVAGNNGQAENLTRKSRTDMKVAQAEWATSQLTNGSNRRGEVNGVFMADREKNIAEIYGYRTFPRNSNGYTVGDTVGGPLRDNEGANLPLENKQLKKVQYGRVTSALSGHSSFDDFREGLPLDPTGKLETYVVSYGVFGQDGTEDHYFYRGIDSITPEQLKDLSAKTAGVLKYWGHAVSYGLDDKWDGNPESNVAPTAIGNTTVGRFVSGNHAHAVVDLKSGDVHGSIYNAWYNHDVAQEARRAGNTDPKAGLYAVDLVKFNGRLATNGNISGTSVYQRDGSTGLFGANLYGSDASEIGGIVASDNKTKEKKWGAVFGGVRVGGGEIQNATNRGGL